MNFYTFPLSTFPNPQNSTIKMAQVKIDLKANTIIITDCNDQINQFVGIFKNTDIEIQTKPIKSETRVLKVMQRFVSGDYELTALDKLNKRLVIYKQYNIVPLRWIQQRMALDKKSLSDEINSLLISGKIKHVDTEKRKQLYDSYKFTNIMNTELYELCNEV